MRRATTTVLIFVALTTIGCKQTGFLAKREAEKCCPTDIRKTVPWCAGEDAIFQAPCEPSATFYGYKPTCWGVWPTSGAVWRDTHCGNVHHEAIITDLIDQNRELIELPQLEPPPVISEIPFTPQEKSVKIEASEEPKDSPAAAEEENVEEVEEPLGEDELPPPLTLGPIRLPAVDDE